MVSRQETARPLLTPGEVMQLPPADELVLVSGVHPIRAKKARYYADRQLASRVLPPPQPAATPDATGAGGRRTVLPDDWSRLPLPAPVARADAPIAGTSPDEAERADDANAGIRCEPELPAHEAIASEQETAQTVEPALEAEPEEEDAVRARVLRSRGRSLARQAAMDPDDGIAL